VATDNGGRQAPKGRPVEKSLAALHRMVQGRTSVPISNLSMDYSQFTINYLLFKK